jgi:hypothetical protein
MSKKIIISLDDDIEFTHVSYNATYKAVNQGVEIIITPCTTFFDIFWIINKGYQVYTRNRKSEICLNDMFLKKEIRFAQNTASMLLSGCFEVAPELNDK